MLAIKRVANVRLGKMVQPNPATEADVEAEYLRAAHVQPAGRLVEVAEKVMWFSSEELRGLHLTTGDVVVVEGGAGFGRSAHIDSPLDGWGYQNSIVRVRPRPGLSEGRFLNYVFQSLLSTGETALSASVATIPHYTAEKVGATRHWIPSVRTQNLIADFLDRETAQIDGMIEAQEDLLRVVEERLSALGESAVFNPAQRPEDSQEVGWMGRVPRRWRVSSLSSLCSLIQTGPFGSQLNADEYEDEGVAVLNPADYPAGHINLRDAKKVPPTTASRLQRHQMRQGDVVTARRGDLGRSAVIQEGSAGSLCGTGSLLVRPHPELLNPDFLVHVLGARKTREALADISVGSTMDNLNSKMLARFRLPVPPLAEQEEIIRALSDASERTKQVRRSALDTVVLMRERREALITAAVTGRINPETGIERSDQKTQKEAS